MKKIVTAILIGLIFLITSCGQSSSSTTKSTDSSLSKSQIEMIDLNDLTYSAALEKLQEAGFTNVSCDFNDFPNWSGDRLKVVGQSHPSGKMLSPDTEIQLKCKKICRFALDISSDANILFSKYDISIYLGNEDVGSVANGKNLSRVYDVVEGEYVLKVKRFNESSPENKTKITVNTDMLFKCSLSHDSSEIEFHDVVSEHLTSEMPDVVGKILSTGKSILDNTPLYNANITPSIDSSDEKNWIIVSQSVPAGTIMELNRQYSLECISLEEHYSAALVGKTLKEAIKSSVYEKIRPLFFSAEDNSDIRSIINNLSDAEKGDWTIVRLETGLDPGTVSLYLKNTLTPEEKAAREQAAAEKAAKEKETAEKAAKEKEAAEKAAKEKEAAAQASEATQPESSAASSAESTASPKDSESSGSEEIKMPIVSGTSLDLIASAAYEYGLSEAYEDTDFQDGTIQKALASKDNKYDLDILYSSSSKELVLADIITYSFASSQEQADFILHMIPVLCPPNDVDSVIAWFNENKGNEAQTEINGVDYQTFLSTGGSLIFEVNMENWENWYLSQG